MAETAVADVGGMSVHTAKPEGSGPSPAVIVIQEIFGVDPHIQDVAKRFADAGYFRGGPGAVPPERGGHGDPVREYAGRVR